MNDGNNRSSRPRQLGFWSLMIAQFQGAFSDNAYKFPLIFILIASNLAARDRDRLVWRAS